MAQPLFSPTSLDFGTVNPGASKSLTIDFINVTTPSGTDVEVTIGVPPAEFAFSENSFTLTEYGETKSVTLTYSPVSVGTDDFSVNIIHDSGLQGPASPYSFSVAAECGAPRTGYALPNIDNHAAGTMKVTMFLPSDVAAPTIPSTVKIKRIGELVESVDAIPGIVEVQNMEMELGEEYSDTYPEGFWYSMIQTDPNREVSFRFVLTEGATDTFYFWGKVYREETEWPEKFVATNETSAIRTVRVRLVSLISSLKEVSINTYIGELLAHESAVSGYWTMTSVLASMVSSSFAQAYSTSNIVIRNTDLKFFASADDIVYTEYEVANLLVKGSDKPASATTRGYFDTTEGTNNPYHWATRFENPYELLRALCLNFGWVCRYFYGQSDGSYVGDETDLHRLEFITRGGAYDSTVAAEAGILESTIALDKTSRPATVRVADFVEATVETNSADTYERSMLKAWAVGGREKYIPLIFLTRDSSKIADAVVPNPPKWEEIDLDATVEFQLDAAGTSTGIKIYAYRSLYANDGGTPRLVGRVQFYDYEAGDWSALEIDNIQSALMLYYHRRFSAGRKQFERKYGSLRFTESGTTTHLNMKPMKRIEINDLIATDTFYATEIRKDFETNTTTVLWIQE